jgi:hypothetical protein
MHELIRFCASRASVVAATLALACSSAFAMQQPDPSSPIASVRLKAAKGPTAPAESASVAAGPRYDVGPVLRWFDGHAYRNLWTTTIRVPVLDLQTYAPGGLKVLKEGGGMQTKNLRFEAGNGDEYVFRLVDKMPSGTPSELHGTPVAEVLQDIVSAQHPASSEIAAPIVEAAGVLHATATLYVMPNDPALGKYRRDFAGKLGEIEPFPSVPKESIDGFAGASKIIDSPELLKLLNTDAKEHVDARAFLAARLTDFLINDNDRHAGQWKWARLPTGPKTQWEPIARDRDHAFVSYDGVVGRAGHVVKASVVTFSGKPSVPGLTSPNDLDQRLLAGLEKSVWDSVAREIQTRVTDSVIHAAAMAMPREYLSTAPRLEAVLKQRRANLRAAAMQYYRELAARVQVSGTDSSDLATITRSADGSVDVRLASGGTTFYSRRFRPDETREILVYLHDGDDTAFVTGHAEQDIVVRVIGGNGNNVFADSSTVDAHAHPTHFYNAGPTSGISYGLDTLFVRLPWEQRKGKLGPAVPNYGADILPHVGLNDPRTLGLTPLLGFMRYTYGFLDRPYSSMLDVNAEYATQFKGARVSALFDKRFEASPLHAGVFGRLSDLQYVNFFGFGNASLDTLPSSNSFFNVHQRQLALNPVVGLAIGQWTDVTLGPNFLHASTDSASSPFLGLTHPYGFGTFNEGGLQLVARYDRHPWRVDSVTPSNHILAVASGGIYPQMMDVTSTFGKATVAFDAALQLPIPTTPTLTFRTGGTKLWGNFPFFEAATIGGDHTTQFIDAQRFAGDASLYATSELLVPLTRFKFVIPVRAGVVGVAEAGRVYVDGSSPGGWHSTAGGGIWIGRVFGSQTVSLIETGGFKSGLQVRLGLSF